MKRVIIFLASLLLQDPASYFHLCRTVTTRDCMIYERPCLGIKRSKIQDPRSKNQGNFNKKNKKNRTFVRELLLIVRRLKFICHCLPIYPLLSSFLFLFVFIVWILDLVSCILYLVSFILYLWFAYSSSKLGLSLISWYLITSFA